MNACELLLFRSTVGLSFVIAGVFARDALTPARSAPAAISVAPITAPPAPAAPAAPESTSCAHDAGMARLSRQGFQELFEDCTAVPAFENGRVVGIKTFRARPNTEAALAGIQNGDVLVRVDDLPVTNIEAFVSLQQRLDEGGCGTVTWRRGAAVYTLHIE